MKDNDSFDIKIILKLVLKYWYILVLSILFSCGYSFYKIRYMDVTYSSSVSILVDDKTTKTDVETAVGSSLFGMRKNLENEVLILKSYPLVFKAVEALKLNVSHYALGEIKHKEIYKNGPYEVSLVQISPKIVNIPLELIGEGMNNYLIKRLDVENDDSPVIEIGRFGDTLSILDAQIVVNKNKFFPKVANRYYFNINTNKQLAERYRNQIKVKVTSDNSTILNVSMTGGVLARQISFLNKLAEVYINKDLLEKDEVANNTIEFIDNQLKSAEQDLKVAEDKMEDFRKGKKIYSTEVSGDNLISNLEELEQRKSELLLSKKYYDYLQDYIVVNTELDNLIAPSTMGVSDGLLTSTIAEINTLYSQKSTLFDLEDISPAKIEINNRINSLRLTLIENIKGIIKSADIQLEDLNQRQNKLEKKIAVLPSTERQYLKIKREFDFNSHIFNYLLEKKAEIGIAKAANSPDNEILEKARVATSRVISTNKKSVYLGNLIYGIGGASLIIFLIYILKYKVSDIEEIEKLSKIQILAKINAFREDTHDLGVIFNEPKSLISEAFRNLRLSLQFIHDNQGSKVISFSSSISGEGKTFCATYCAASLAFSGKKVVLLGCDLRKPKILDYFDIESSLGLSTYLSGTSSKANVLFSSKFENLDIIPSGPIPPNPAELLEESRFAELILELKKNYDYVICDTSPIGLVADYFLLSKYVDTTILLIRQDYTNRSYVKSLNEVVESGRLNHCYLVFNGFSISNSYGYYGKNYGYGYGYIRDNKNESFMKRFFKIKN